MHTRICLLQFIFLCSCAAADAPPAAELPNKYCPVMLDTLAKPAYSLKHKGRVVYFCCTDCMKEFEDAPDIYEKNLPWYKPESKISIAIISLRVGEFLRRHAGAVGALVAWLLALLIIRRGAKSQNPDTRARYQSGAVRWGVLAVLLVLGMAGEIFLYENEVKKAAVLKAKTELEDRLSLIHFATFSDHGAPPQVRPPNKTPEMTATYYRGNDEREKVLYNSGNYLTCTFKLSFQTQDGRTLQVGDKIKPGDTFLSVEILRATPSTELFSERIIKSIFLTRSGARDNGSKPLPDAVHLSVLEKSMRWEARYPVAFTGGEKELKDLVYICQEFKFGYDKPIGSRFHYGMQYHLFLKDGVVTEGSGVWMAAMYRTRRLPAWTIPADEWLGQKPLPVKPKEFDTTNRKLLGLDDYNEIDGKKKAE